MIISNLITHKKISLDTLIRLKPSSSSSHMYFLHKDISFSMLESAWSEGDSGSGGVHVF